MDIYANCNFTRSGYSDIRFNVIIKVSKEALKRLRQRPENEKLPERQVLGTLAGQVVPVSTLTAAHHSPSVATRIPKATFQPRLKGESPMA
jgi:hypothetical protein